MLKLRKEIVVKAPIAEVFDYIDEPANLPQIWPGLFEVKDVATLPTGGHKWQFLYNFAGKHVKGTTETFERVPYERIVDKTMGEVKSTFTWKFLGQNGTTKIFLEAEYEPPKFFTKEQMPFVLRHNEYEAENVLANLKAWFEAS